MTATALLSIAGQSIWVDNITRSMLQTGQLKKYIDTYSVVGLTSNPTIFEKAITGSNDYDPQIRDLLSKGIDGEKLFFELAITDLTKAADLFKPIHALTGGVDGWVSLEVSPLLARDAKTTIDQAVTLHAKANRPNLFIKVPGTAEGLPAIVCEPLGQEDRANVARQFEEHRRHCSGASVLQGILRTLCQRSFLEVASRGRASATIPFRQHQHQGSKACGHYVCEGARRGAHREHHARVNAE